MKRKNTGNIVVLEEIALVIALVAIVLISGFMSGTDLSGLAANIQYNAKPQIGIQHSPQEPQDSNVVVINADASDSSGVKEIRIYVDGREKKICTFSMKSSGTKASGRSEVSSYPRSGKCFYSSRYSKGEHIYNARLLSSSGLSYDSGKKNMKISGKPLPATEYSFVLKWKGAEPFVVPDGIAIENNKIFVTDNTKVQIFDLNGRSLSTIGSNVLYSPNGVAVDSQGNIYVADSDKNRIRKLDPSGSLIGEWGRYGSGNGEFSFPHRVAVDELNNVYVSDFRNNRIQKFDSNGRFIKAWGSVCNMFTDEGCIDMDGSGPMKKGDGQFMGPVGVNIDKDGNVYVTEYFNHRVQKFTSDGKFIRKFGSVGQKDGQFILPMGVTTDDMGYVYVADSGNHRIQKFDSDGKYVAKFGSLGSENGQFNNPYDVALDAGGNVFVSDRVNARMQKFAPVK